MFDALQLWQLLQAGTVLLPQAHCMTICPGSNFRAHLSILIELLSGCFRICKKRVCH